MPLKILVVPDKFKGTLSAHDAAVAIARGWRSARPTDRIRLLPMSDGGDGFGEVISNVIGAQVQHVTTLNAAHQRCRAAWWWQPKTKTAIIESARVIGLAQLPAGKFHPFDLDTFGLGHVLTAAATKGAKRCVIGIGGSATNDGGFGLARALGWEFLDGNGVAIEQWTRLHALVRIQRPRHRTVTFADFRVAVDVGNPLLGRRGATRVYGPQKGLRPQELERAERCLRRMASVFESQFGRKLAVQTGAGAAGGLGFGLMAFLGAEAEAGFELFARASRLRSQLRWGDLVFTAEGRMDRSTLMGKGVGEIGRECRRLSVPCVGLSGEASQRKQLERVFDGIYALTEITDVASARRDAAHWLEKLSQRMASAWSETGGRSRKGKARRHLK